MKRSDRKQQAEQTVLIAHQGWYEAPSGQRVDIADAVAHCLDGTRAFTPGEMARLVRKALARPARAEPTRIEVHAETTLAGVRRLLAEQPQRAVAALNFASAKNPGGGFLNGSEAQEESLARSSALYVSQLRAADYYDDHRQTRSCLYTDAMILSPACPVFRADDGTLLEEPYAATFLTSCAPNAGAVARNTPHELDQVPDVLRRRGERVLALAAAHDYEAIVLGAWGCGVFGNEPDVVAGIFRDLLTGTWAGRFARVVFAIFDRSPEQATLAAFRGGLGV